MHEGALCREIMDVTERAAKINGLSRIHEILVAAGPYSGIHEGQLNFYFDVAKQGTVMADGVIRLVIDESLIGPRQIYVRSISGE